jgi:hypothetical protein
VTAEVYADSKPCRVCGAEIELSRAEGAASTTEPDDTIDQRTCTNRDCPTNRSAAKDP